MACACEKCGSKKRVLTKHSLSGSHRPPYIYICRICHDKIHRMPRYDAKAKAMWQRLGGKRQ